MCDKMILPSGVSLIVRVKVLLQLVLPIPRNCAMYAIRLCIHYSYAHEILSLFGRLLAIAVSRERP